MYVCYLVEATFVKNSSEALSSYENIGGRFGGENLFVTVVVNLCYPFCLHTVLTNIICSYHMLYQLVGGGKQAVILMNVIRPREICDTDLHFQYPSGESQTVNVSTMPKIRKAKDLVEVFLKKGVEVFTFAPNNQSDSISGFTEDPKYHGSFETRFSRDRDSSRGHVGIFKTVFSNKVLKEEMLVSTDGEEAERLMSLTQVESLVYCVINNVVCVLIPEFSSFM